MMTYFLTVFLLLIAGAILINGWFLVTRGQWYDEVDGRRIKEGALLKGWYFFWFQETGNEVLYFKGEAFHRAFRLLKDNPKTARLNPTIADKSRWPEPDRPVVIMTAEAVEHGNQTLIYDVAGVEIIDVIPRHEIPESHRQMLFVKHQPTYKFPEWVRTVMAGCITCFSSVYGSLFFWSVYGVLGDEFYRKHSSHPTLLLIATWLFYIVSLAYVNTYFWKRIDNK